jgi:hypothetical protein
MHQSYYSQGVALSAEGAKCNRPAQRAGCGDGQMTERSKRDINCFPKKPSTYAALSALLDFINESYPGRWPGYYISRLWCFGTRV